MTEHRLWYRAICKACGATMRSADDPRFLTPFFLPADCVDCGEHHNRYVSGWSSPDSEIVTIRERYVRKPFKLLKPSTWVGEWVRVTASQATTSEPAPPVDQMTYKTQGNSDG